MPNQPTLPSTGHAPDSRPMDRPLAAGQRFEPIRVLRWIGHLLLCSAYLQGGIDKALDFHGAIAEMEHFGLHPAGPMALLTILGEIGASLMILSGIYRWLGALYLSGFTLAATMLALRFWELSGPARFGAENSFFEHLGLTGAFLIVALIDIQQRRRA